MEYKELRNRWKNTKDAAEYLGLTQTALRQRKAAGKFEGCYTKMGGSVRYDVLALDALMESRRSE